MQFNRDAFRFADNSEPRLSRSFSILCCTYLLEADRTGAVLRLRVGMLLLALSLQCPSAAQKRGGPVPPAAATPALL